MKRIFRLIFWFEIVLAFVYFFIHISAGLQNVMSYFKGIKELSHFNMLMYNVTDNLYSVSLDIVLLIYPILNFTFWGALFCLMPIIVLAPIFYHVCCKPTAEIPKARTYWWKLCISGALLLISLVCYLWAMIQMII